MAKKRMAAVKLTRLEARTRAIQGAGKLALIACSLSLGFVVVATAFPQRRKLDKLEAKLVIAKQREHEVMQECDYRKTELQALREDPEYLEIHARDRLGYCRPGERVLRFSSEH
jgi:cell division protein FtsB